MNTETEMQAVAEALARLGYASLAKIVKKTEKERDSLREEVLRLRAAIDAGR